MKKRNLIFIFFILGCVLSLTLLLGQGSFAQEGDISKLRQKIDALEAKILKLEGLLGECSELGTTSEYGWQSKKNWRRLEVGMANTQVKSILGEPTKVIKGIQDLWYYPNIYGGYVSFDKDGKLAGWNEP
jgi:hypothetical protein